MRFSQSPLSTAVVALAIGAVASVAMLPLSAHAQRGRGGPRGGDRGGYDPYYNPLSSFSASSEASSDSSFYGGPRGRRYLVDAAQANRPLTVLAVRAPRADDPEEARAAPGTQVVELADAGAKTAPQGQDLRIAVNADRAATLAPGSTVRPRMAGADGVQLFAGSTLVAFVPTPADGSGVGDGTRVRS